MGKLRVFFDFSIFRPSNRGESWNQKFTYFLMYKYLSQMAKDLWRKNVGANETSNEKKKMEN